MRCSGCWIRYEIMSESAVRKTGEQASSLRQARYFLWLASEQRKRGEFEVAIELCEVSIDVHPTAEAHTFLGWTYSLQKRYAEAIESCMSAILVDPTYGNPYNDIGVYLFELGRLNDAVLYLQQAKQSSRYDAYHFPYFNLGRIYEAQCRFDEALREYEGALVKCPDHRPSQKALLRISARLN